MSGRSLPPGCRKAVDPLVHLLVSSGRVMIQDLGAPAVFARSFAGVAMKFGFLFLAKMYIIPYWINVMWLDVVTFLHHTDKEVRGNRASFWIHAQDGDSQRVEMTRRSWCRRQGGCVETDTTFVISGYPTA